MDSALYFCKESNVKRACEAKLTPISVDFDAKTGVFPASKGSSTYTCSLDSCSCTDFAINHKPCKHMIRLAYELNIIDLPGVASSASAAQEKIILAAVDDFVKNASLPAVIRTFRSLSNLKDGVVVSDEDIRFAADCLPFFVTEKNVFRLELWPVFKSFTAKVNNRLGLLLTKHIGEISSQTLDEIFFLDDPSYSFPKTASKKKNRPDISVEDLLSILTQKEIAFKDLRNVGGCLWIESTTSVDSLLKSVMVSGKRPVSVPNSRHFGNRRAWYVK